MMDFAVDLRDEASPVMASLMAKNRRITSEAIRDTVFQHRRKLKEYMQRTGPLKKMLDENGLVKIRAVGSTPSKESFKRANRDKHDHRTALPWYSKKAGKPPLWNALRFTSADTVNIDYPLAYQFGFIDTRTRKSAFMNNLMPASVKGAARYAMLQAKGEFFNKKTGTSTDSISPEMRRYFGAMGIGIKRGKTKLNIPKRNPIDRYLKAHQAEIVFDFRRNFAKRLKRHMDREEARAKASARTTTYSTTAKATAKTFADRYYETGKKYYA
jgi:hypothetical protein